MDTCDQCNLPFKDGDQVVMVTDAVIFNDGEYDHGNTWRYHAACISGTEFP